MFSINKSENKIINLIYQYVVYLKKFEFNLMKSVELKVLYSTSFLRKHY